MSGDKLNLASQAHLDEIARLKAENTRLKEELKEGDYWQKRAKEAFESGVCPICFCDDESGHDPGCYVGQCEARMEAAEKRVQELEETEKGLLNQVSLLLAQIKDGGTSVSPAEWRLSHRLAQAEGLLRSKADRLKIPCGNNWIPDPDVAAFLHPEQEKKDAD